MLPLTSPASRTQPPIPPPRGAPLPPRLPRHPGWPDPVWTKLSRRILGSSLPTAEVFLGWTREIMSAKGKERKYESGPVTIRKKGEDDNDEEEEQLRPGRLSD